ncbi:MAG: PD-(D/E)XK nuclease family protein [Brockia lithotrophica]|nr:PD-(D/E)XK nuclease family protein [Brockia lithotrophica]
MIEVRMSPTSISTLHTCPHKYYLQYVLKIPTPPTEALFLGNAVHKVLEQTFEPTDEDIVAAMESSLTELFTDEIKKNLVAKVELRKIQRTFVEKFYQIQNSVHVARSLLREIDPDFLTREIAKEQKFEIPFESEGLPDDAKFMLVGKMDAFFFRGKELIIVDYKTNQFTTPSEFQLHFYEYIARKALKTQRVNRVNTFFLMVQQGTIVPAENPLGTDERMTEFENYLKHTAFRMYEIHKNAAAENKNVSGVENENVPERSFRCEYCPYVERCLRELLPETVFADLKFIL